ncbi:hypothetical protein G9A89_016252 [Geosiphon pyriformis]|nr:hypothetical protein G9A89_016252 [Geosiphon pyriformis]
MEEKNFPKFMEDEKETFGSWEEIENMDPMEEDGPNSLDSRDSGEDDEVSKENKLFAEHDENDNSENDQDETDSIQNEDNYPSEEEDQNLTETGPEDLEIANIKPPQAHYQEDPEPIPLLERPEAAKNFKSYYLEQLTAAFGEDLDKIRKKENFDTNRLEILIDSLESNIKVFSDVEKELAKESVAEVGVNHGILEYFEEFSKE